MLFELAARGSRPNNTPCDSLPMRCLAKGSLCVWSAALPQPAGPGSLEGHRAGGAGGAPGTPPLLRARGLLPPTDTHELQTSAGTI